MSQCCHGVPLSTYGRQGAEEQQSPCNGNKRSVTVTVPTTMTHSNLIINKKVTDTKTGKRRKYVRLRILVTIPAICVRGF